MKGKGPETISNSGAPNSAESSDYYDAAKEEKKETTVELKINNLIHHLIDVESTSKGQFEAVKLTIEELENKVSKLSPVTATLSFQERVRKSILKKIMTMKSNPNLLNDLLTNTKSTVQPVTPVKELRE